MFYSVYFTTLAIPTYIPCLYLSYRFYVDEHTEGSPGGSGRGHSRTDPGSVAVLHPKQRPGFYITLYFSFIKSKPNLIHVLNFLTYSVSLSVSLQEDLVLRRTLMLLGLSIFSVFFSHVIGFAGAGGLCTLVLAFLAALGWKTDKVKHIRTNLRQTSALYTQHRHCLCY